MENDDLGVTIFAWKDVLDGPTYVGAGQPYLDGPLLLLSDDCILKEYGSSRGCRASPRSPNFAFSALNSH